MPMIDLDIVVTAYLHEAEEVLGRICSVEYSTSHPSREEWVMVHVAMARGLIAAVRTNLIESAPAEKEDIPF